MYFVNAKVFNQLLQVGHKDLSQFLKMKPVRFFDRFINIKGEPIRSTSVFVKPPNEKYSRNVKRTIRIVPVNEVLSNGEFQRFGER